LFPLGCLLYALSACQEDSARVRIPRYGSPLASRGRAEELSDPRCLSATPVPALSSPATVSLGQPPPLWEPNHIGVVSLKTGLAFLSGAFFLCFSRSHPCAQPRRHAVYDLPCGLGSTTAKVWLSVTIIQKLDLRPRVDAMGFWPPDGISPSSSAFPSPDTAHRTRSKSFPHCCGGCRTLGVSAVDVDLHKSRARFRIKNRYEILDAPVFFFVWGLGVLYLHLDARLSRKTRSTESIPSVGRDRSPVAQNLATGSFT